MPLGLELCCSYRLPALIAAPLFYLLFSRSPYYYFHQTISVTNSHLITNHSICANHCFICERQGRINAQPRLIGNTCLYIHFCKTEKTYLKQHNKNTTIRACTNVIKTCHCHVLNVCFSATLWTFHFETATKLAARYIITVLQKCM